MVLKVPYEHVGRMSVSEGCSGRGKAWWMCFTGRAYGEVVSVYGVGADNAAPPCPSKILLARMTNADTSSFATQA